MSLLVSTSELAAVGSLSRG